MTHPEYPPSLEVNQLTVNYDKTPALWDISLEVPPGKIVGIIGPNGAGKSSFIKTVLGFIRPLSGHVLIGGEPLTKARQRVAYVPQRSSVDWDFPITVRELVLMGRYGKLGLFRSPRQADYVAVDHTLNLVGLTEYADRQISQLSGGQQQRAFVARALVQDVDYYFFDEPFAGVDLATEKELVRLMHQLRNQGKTLFVVHHDLNTVENYFDWLIVLNMRLIASGPTLEVFNADVLNEAYGKSYALLDEAFRLSRERSKGVN